MLFIKIFFYALCVFLCFFIFYEIVKNLEHIYSVFFKGQVPFVPSSNGLRKKLIEEINKNYKDAKLICELGCGYGGLSRYIAKHTNAKVIGIENMPFSYSVAKVADFLFAKKSETIYMDAFRYLEETKQKFDIVVCYLDPDSLLRLKEYKDKFKVLITFDFEAANLKPKKVINLNRGYVLYNYKKYPHKIFIYEF